MKNSHTKRSAALWAGLFLAMPMASGQDKKPEVWLPPEAMPGTPTKDPRKELEEAFRKVEINLQGLNLLLLDASKGDTTRLANSAGSGFDELLQRAENRPAGAPTDALSELLYASQGQGQSVLEGIDEILRIADENSKGGGGGGPGMCSIGKGGSASESNNPSESGGKEDAQKQDSTGKKKMQGQENPEGQTGEKPGQQQMPGDSGEPKGNQDPKEGDKPGSKKPAAGETGEAQNVLPGTGTWGNLPLHMRDIFRSEGGSDMPARYRDWIDNYYRRLNKEGSR